MNELLVRGAIEESDERQNQMIRMRPSLKRRLQLKAITTGKCLSDVIEEALEAYLGESAV